MTEHQEPSEGKTPENMPKQAKGSLQSEPEKSVDSILALYMAAIKALPVLTTKEPTAAQVNELMDELLDGPRRIRRLPALEEICPAEQWNTESFTHCRLS